NRGEEIQQGVAPLGAATVDGPTGATARPAVLGDLCRALGGDHAERELLRKDDGVAGAVGHAARDRRRVEGRRGGTVASQDAALVAQLIDTALQAPAGEVTDRRGRCARTGPGRKGTAAKDQSVARITRSRTGRAARILRKCTSPGDRVA